MKLLETIADPANWALWIIGAIFSVGIFCALAYALLWAVAILSLLALRLIELGVGYVIG